MDADSEARAERLPIMNSSGENVTTKMLCEGATPTHMMAPLSAGTLRVVWVINKNQEIPARAAGNAEIMMKGSSQDWKLTTINRYTRTIENASPPRRPM